MFHINTLQSLRKLWPCVSKLYFPVSPLFLLFSEAQKCVHDLVLKGGKNSLPKQNQDRIDENSIDQHQQH